MMHFMFRICQIQYPEDCIPWTGREDRRLLKLGVSKTAIAKLTGVSRTTLYSFMRTRGLKPRP